MIKHIVMWRFKEEAEGASKLENMRRVKKQLEALVGVVPSLLSMEVGIGVTHGDMAYDMALISCFADLEGLEAYKVDPRHRAISAFVSRVRLERATVDFLVEETN